MARDSGETITHRIGAAGALILRTVSGSVRVRGMDGEEVRIQAHLDLHRDEDAGAMLEVIRGEGELRVEVRGHRQRGLAGLLRSSPGGHLDVEMPRGGTLRLAGVSADLEITDVHGEQEYRTVSGDLAIAEGSGAITLTTVSGDVRVGGTDLRLEVSSTSGDVAVDADRIEAVHVRSLSGDVHVAGALAAGHHHRVESVSGNLQLMPAGGLRLQVSGFSSDVDSELPYRDESQAGRRVLVIGDGAALVAFRTMSGDASVIAGRFEGDPGDASVLSSYGSGDRRLRPPGLPRRPDRPGPLGPEFGRSYPPASPEPPLPPAPDSRLEILRAVERGEISVDEATRLLEGD